MKQLLLSATLFLSAVTFAQRDNAKEHNNIILEGWVLVDSEVKSTGIDNGLFFGATDPYKSTVGIFSNRNGTYGPFAGLNLVTDKKVRLVIDDRGKVGIGTTNPSALLSVNGTILTKDVEISVRNTDWPDYVFDEQYDLRSIESLQKYVKENKHLPYIPSKAEIDKNEKYNLNEVSVNMLRTIEELSLHIIQLNEKINKIEKELNNKL